MNRRNFLSYTVSWISAATAALTGCKNKNEVGKSKLEQDLEEAESHMGIAFTELYNNGSRQKALEEYEKATAILDASNPFHRDMLFRVYRQMKDVYNEIGDTEKSREMTEKLKRL